MFNTRKSNLSPNNNNDNNNTNKKINDSNMSFNARNNSPIFN